MGGVWPTAASAAPLDVSIQQLTVLCWEVFGLKQLLLPLDVSIQQKTVLSCTVTSRDVNLCYPDRVPLTQFVHIAKKNYGMWA
jgi:hypothetical protein